MTWLSQRPGRAEVLAAAALLTTAAPAAAQVTFTLFEQRPEPFWSSYAYDVSADGSTVVGGAFSTLGGGAVRWTPRRGIEFLGSVVDSGVQVRLDRAFGVSADGSVIAGHVPGGRGFRWVDGGGAILFGAWNPVTADVSADGSVIVGTLGSTGGVPFAYSWKEGEGFRTFHRTPWNETTFRAGSISGDGSIVVGYAGSYPTSGPVIWTEADGYSLLPYPSATGSIQGRAFGISTDGAFVVGEAVDNGGRSQARWSLADGGFQWLGELPGGPWEGAARACSADGSVVVGWSRGLRGQEATIWRAGDDNIRSIKEMLLTDYGIDVGGRLLTAASSVSDDGTVICGHSTGTDGLPDGWVLRLDTQTDCPCDFDRPNPAITVVDLIAYLDAWFARDAAADFNADVVIDIHDLLAFLDCWFRATSTAPC